MSTLPDGLYQTYPIHGPHTATRQIEIKNGVVRIGGYTFTQDDFFKVNALSIETT